MLAVIEERRPAPALRPLELVERGNPIRASDDLFGA